MAAKITYFGLRDLASQNNKCHAWVEGTLAEILASTPTAPALGKPSDSTTTVSFTPEGGWVSPLKNNGLTLQSDLAVAAPNLATLSCTAFPVSLANPAALYFSAVRTDRTANPLAGRTWANLDFCAYQDGAWEFAKTRNDYIAQKVAKHPVSGKLYVISSGSAGFVSWSWDGSELYRIGSIPLNAFSGIDIIQTGTYKGRIILVAADGGVNASGAWYSDDELVTLVPINLPAGYTGYPYNPAVDSAGTVYLSGKSGFTVAKSVDGGANFAWTAASPGVSDWLALACNGTAIYAGGQGSTIRKSVDGGANWTTYTATTKSWRNFAWISATMYAATSTGVFSTTDGVTWTPVTGAFPGTSYRACSYIDGILYCGRGDASNTWMEFSTDGGSTGWYTEEGTGITLSGGKCNFTEVGAKRYRRLSRWTSAPYFAAKADVVFSQTPVYVGSGTDSTFDVAILGIRKNPRNYLQLEVNNLTGSWIFRGAYNGTAFNSATTWQATTQAMTLAVSVDGGLITGWYNNGEQWIPVAQYQIPAQTVPELGASLDIKHWNLRGWFFEFGAYTSVAASVLSFKNFTVGPVGRVGLRDLTHITHEDGSPVVLTNGLIPITATVAPPAFSANSGFGVSGAHCGIFLYDPASRTLSEEVGRILCAGIDSNSYPFVTGHSPIKVVYDRPNGRWIYLISDWGGAAPGSGTGKSLRYATTTVAPYSGDITIDASNVLVSATPNFAYDADLIIKGGVYKLLIAGGAAATADTGILTATSLEGLKTAAITLFGISGEGPKWCQFGGRTYINIQGRLLDETGAAIPGITRLNIDQYPQSTVGTPHYPVIPVETPQGTRYDILTFDFVSYVSGGSTGYFTILSSQTVPGKEVYA